MGYIRAVAHGFDWGTNANSHFLYLNLHHLLIQISGADPVLVMRWASVLWAIGSLFLVYQIGSEINGKACGLYSMQGVAMCFTFWRHACIVEVYTMFFFFWCLAILGLVKLSNAKPMGQHFLLWGISAGILVHIEMSLLIPVAIGLLWYKRVWSPMLLVYLLFPLLVFGYSTLVLKANSVSAIFFDAIAGQMLDIEPSKLFIGPVVIVGMLFVLVPVPLGLGFYVAFLSKSFVPPKSLVWLCLGASALPVFGFCSLYATPGIHVFLLPVVLVLSVWCGYVLSVGVRRYDTGFIAAMPLAQLLFCWALYVGGSFLLSAKLRPEDRMKGGFGYYVLPWARGNATSVLDVARRLPDADIPEALQWNIADARKWMQETNAPEKK